MRPDTFCKRLDLIISHLKAAKEDAADYGVGDGLLMTNIAKTVLDNLVIEARDAVAAGEV